MLQNKLWLSPLILGLAVVILVFLAPPDRSNGPPVHTHAPNGVPYADLPVWHSEYQTTFTDAYTASEPFPESELDTCHAPVPMSDRVRNYTGIQCVFSSIELLGRWAEEPKLMDPPITSRSNCKSYSGPSDAGRKLDSFGVKFKQVTNKEEGRQYLQKYVAEEGRGALIGVPGHALCVIHYDPEGDDIRIVDNSDRTLSIQKWSKSHFERRWQGWVLVLFADKDVIPYKIGPSANKIPIQDRDDPNREFPPNHIPRPLED